MGGTCLLPANSKPGIGGKKRPLKSPASKRRVFYQKTRLVGGKSYAKVEIVTKGAHWRPKFTRSRRPGGYFHRPFGWAWRPVHTSDDANSLLKTGACVSHRASHRLPLVWLDGGVVAHGGVGLPRKRHRRGRAASATFLRSGEDGRRGAAVFSVLLEVKLGRIPDCTRNT